MATFKYKPYQQGKSIKIYIFFSYGRKKLFRKDTNITLEKIENWNRETNNIKLQENASSDSTTLRRHKYKFLEIYEKAVSNHEIIDNQFLHDLYNSIEDTKDDKKIKSQFDFNKLFEEYIEYCNTKKLTNTGNSLAESTIASYGTCYNILKKFQKNNKKIRARHINKNLFEDIQYFLKNKSENGVKSYSLNYRGVIIKNLKTLFKWMINDKNIELPNYKQEEWKRYREKVDKIALSIEEIQRLFLLDLSDKEKIYSEVRDAWILMALTGTSYIDAKNLTNKNIITIKGHKFIQYYRIKTQNISKIKCLVPVSPLLKTLMDKHNSKMPYVPSETNINKYIKKVCKICGMTEEMNFYKTINDKKKLITKYKYDRVHCHTARRTFTTAGYGAGLELINLRQMTGHSSDRELMNYIKVSPEQHALRSAKHDFFTSSLSLIPQLKKVS